MAKRLSAIFSSSKDDHSSTDQQHIPKSATAPTLAPPKDGRLHKTLPVSPSQPILPSATLPNLPITPLQPPPLLTGDGMFRPPSSAGSGSRPPSQASVRSRPQTPTFAITPVDSNSPVRPSTPGSATRLNKRSSWLPGKSSKGGKDDQKHSRAWIAGLPDHVPYDLNPLLSGERVLDLWNDQAECFLYLFPKGSRKGPSFKVDSSLFDSSAALKLLHLEAAQNGHNGVQALQQQFGHMAMQESDNGYYRGAPAGQYGYQQDAGYYQPQQEVHIHLPLEFDHDLTQSDNQPKGDDTELLVLYRNFFAFLQGGALIATARQTSLYAVFMGISSILKRFRFSNADGSTWGDVSTQSFSRYCQELRLADVRASREKTVEAIVLGEQMRFWPLYNEGFVHAGGRLDDIKRVKTPKYNQITPTTVSRLERASLDIEQRLLIVRNKLETFDFPSMFSGVANSQTATEAKLVRFKAWKIAFADFRKFTISYYRRKYGAWPPKASSKKNNFEESGLNRRLLQEVYNDFTDLYDMLVDKRNMTTRTSDVLPIEEAAAADDQNESIQHALRRVEDEYDRASPPVLPPIPFDVPIIPGYKQSFNRVHVVASKSANSVRRLKDNEVNEVLLGSYNRDHITSNVFIQDFFAYERKLNQGKTMDELGDSRCGQWLFMYAILQSLPHMVVDARDLQFKEGVEYFLCIAPRNGRPWMKEDTSHSRAWTNVPSGGGLVSLPADSIDHSVEGSLRRSHCWTMGSKWAEELGIDPAQASVTLLGGLPPPPALNTSFGPPLHSHGHGHSHSHNPSHDGFRSSTSAHSSPSGSPMLKPMSASDGGRLSTLSSRSSVGMDHSLSATSGSGSRPTSVYNPTITFDQILAGTPTDDKKKKKK